MEHTIARKLIALISGSSKKESLPVCAGCGDEAQWSFDSWSLLLKGGKWAHFCSPGCMANHLENHPDYPVARRSYKGAFGPLEERRCWTLNGCEYCEKEDETARYMLLDVPYESLWDRERGPDFCSMRCLIAALRKDAEFFGRRWGHGHEGLPVDGPLEEPHQAAALKRLRQKLRPRELARLGF